MPTDPNVLLQAAKCFKCIPKGLQMDVLISLIVQWANHLTPPVPGCQFQGPAWMLTPSLIFTGDEIGIQAPLNPFPPPFNATYAILAWGTTSGVYPNQLTVPEANFNAPFALLTPPLSSHFLAGTTYYFVVRTFDDAGHCSDLSDELSHFFPGVPHASTPVWLPTTEQVTWTDTNGIFTGDYPTFAANVSVASLTSMVFGATGNLTSLTNLGTAPALVTLDVNTNALTALDCTGLAALTTLNCSSNASLTTLTLTGCTALVTLNCAACALTALDVSTCVGLVTLTCFVNAITTLDLTNNTSLTTLVCHHNQLGTSGGVLDVTGLINLTSLDCDTNFITHIDGINTCVSLQSLVVANGLIDTLVINNLSALTNLDVSNCFLTTLDLTGNTAIGNAVLQNNELGTLGGVLDVTGCSVMTFLDCSINSLTTITGLSTCVALLTLNCGSNSLATLNLSACTSLGLVACNDNLITALTLTGLASLTDLNSNSNQLLSLDVSTCVALLHTFCSSCTLNQAAVDNVLCALDANGLLNGSLDISSNTAPSAAGLVCSANLDPGKGWSVTHD